MEMNSIGGHHPDKLVEIKKSIAIKIESPNHGHALLVGPRVTELTQHPLQPLGGYEPTPLVGLEHLESPPQVLALAFATVPLHQPHEALQVQPALVAASQLARLADRREISPELLARDLPVSVGVEVPEHSLVLFAPRERRDFG